MLDKEKIFQIMRAKGPLIPVQISKEINQNILMSSAILSEMASRKEVKVSNLKIGGSPLYYLEGQEPKLQDFSHKLSPKEKPVYDQLREKQIINEKILSPQDRVAVRMIKDFAVPLKVTFNNQVEIFWKWYLIPNPEAELMIKQNLGIIKPPVETVQQSSQQPQPPQPSPGPSLETPVEPQPTAPTPVQESPAPIEPAIQPPMPDPPIQEAQYEPPVIKQPAQTESPGKPKQPEPAPEPKPAPKQTPKSEPKKVLTKPKPQPKQKIQKSPQDLQDPFIDKVDEFFSRNSIMISNKDIIKKGEAEYIITLGTRIGNIRFFVKAKSKKRISEPDISTALIQANENHLSLLFISDGDVSKTVIDLFDTRFRSIVFKKIE